MRQTLQLRLGQQLTMTPQLQQAIRLLQLSSLELRAEIQQALESNMMLELDEEGEHAGDEESAAAEEDATPAEEAIPDELALDTSWDEIYDGATALSAPGREDGDPLDNRAHGAGGLREHLLEQIELERFSERDRALAEVVVDALGEDGYLAVDVAELCEALPADWAVEPAELEAVRQRIRHLDPAGVGARNLQEALLPQLRQLPAGTPWRDAALTAVSEHLDTLAERSPEALAAALGIDAEAGAEVLALIRTLDPRPGLQVASAAADYIVPDVTVSRRDGRWRVELNSETAPRLRINAYYASLIRQMERGSDSSCLRSHLQEARWLIKSLRSRNETLLRVASAIVERQQGFFEHGEEAMQPLVLREIAEAVEMHESTVSRITTNKYMDTPRGTLEFKYFFSSHVQTRDGGEASATAIRARIRRLIAEEDRCKPLSDSAIARILQEEGIQVARRTVAKYRESLSIAPSAERKTPRRATR
ncbi:RNA polymerase factor sigma-54 [Halorhodospira neutriphila]|uniref:RNA polymerase sigma-54 factor n=1 Tax=Halorhodospira neutriphila TaxID=168379 RepID=A0ABS1E478_9GAMM|nr:RNA polymerase factor sigma-54 [Halorhodospira neutriphila]MBK1726541.1 RNA polymerase factor sigma-54 [Halorhodospira neutriphila]